VGRFKVDLKREPNALVGYLLAALELLTGSVHLNERVVLNRPILNRDFFIVYKKR